MDLVYHYTKDYVLEKIITKETVNFKSTRYDKFGNGEYSWIKDRADIAIKEICENNQVPYDEEPLSLVPFTISFCRHKSLRYMWENYADNFNGIQLIFNFMKIQNFALRSCNPNVFMPCHYMESKDDIKEVLNDMYNKYYMPKSTLEGLQFDLMECSACLKQIEYKDENEYRFLYPHHNVLSASYNGINVSFTENETNEGLSKLENEWTKMVLFPKDFLEGIVVGHCMTDERLNSIKQYLKFNGYNNIADNIKRIKEEEYE